MKKSIKPGTLAFPTPVWCVGSYDGDGKPNVMTIAWGGICCSAPVSLTVSLRKATYTYQSILDRGAYTVSIPSVKYVAEADYFGLASGKNTDKFVVTGLTPVRSDLVDAPYVEEFPVIFECKLIQTVELGLHTQFIGEIVGIKADENILDEKGMPLMDKAQSFVFAPSNKDYRAIGDVVGQGFKSGKKFIS
ncbi:flavin reductase family protein [Maridesulfovibrio hydrothermalis]|uniref:Flavoredoxin n=1 Tax=Maridesulfovibrio hydrothermalis AM13 = DSM 14728 TaxID=1121451 RepID=L0RCD1_9BACT|nr:flavin reductase family protein [Maridesulfovibrio hydrothermalis]CCO24418.1 Flavoredoxin [Maridesulfovibrio hydrothermalis AM13 = DSM 14728]